MNTRAYLTFTGNCAKAIDLYQRAFSVKVSNVLRFSDAPELVPKKFPLSDDQKGWILQATLDFGGSIIRVSDTVETDHIAPTELIGIAVECSCEQAQHAFAVLRENGTVKMPLTETDFSPHHGSVIDRFGVKWEITAKPVQAFSPIAL